MRPTITAAFALLSSVFLPTCDAAIAGNDGETTAPPGQTAADHTGVVAPEATGVPEATGNEHTKADEPSSHKPCEPPPDGMVCVPGGPAIVGADDREDNERPRHQVEVGTFYMDAHEVTNGQYLQCEMAEICPRRRNLPSSYKTFLEKDQPAIPITWPMAYTYCRWAGKRLPSEAEWEKAARGGTEARLYPWGNDEPTCERAAYKGCKPAKTHAVGSFAPGPYGIYDMAGNGFEWVHDWASPCYDGCDEHACGDACLRDNPRGPCDGVSRCPSHKQRVLKGGSWYWPSHQMRGSYRRAQSPHSGLHRLSFRCASTEPWLSTFPPLALSEPKAALADPEPPTAEELQKLRSVPDDKDIFKIEPCKRKGLANLDCRDPMTYIKSNEAAQHVWRAYIANLGGGYVGLGADQSYSLIAAARSRWAWIFDYDPNVARIHTIIRIVVLQSETPAQFVEAFSPKRESTTREWIRTALAADELERRAVEGAFKELRWKLWRHYEASAEPKGWKRGYGWLRYRENYAYVRKLLQQGRVHAVKGNMLTNVTLPSIAASARSLGVPIRIYYPSNAEEQWKLTPQYRANVAGLPFDDESVILRTMISSRYRHDDESESYWHYIVHWGRDAQQRIQLEGYTNVNQFTDEKTETQLEHVSLIRMPAKAGAKISPDANVPPRMPKPKPKPTDEALEAETEADKANGAPRDLP